MRVQTKRLPAFLLILVFFGAISSCGDRSGASDPVSATGEGSPTTEVDESAPDDSVDVLDNGESTGSEREELAIELFVPTREIDTSAHEPYLSEEAVFTTPVLPPVPEAPYYALVASDQAVVHHSGRLMIRAADSPYMPPIASIESEAQSVPIGTVLPIFDVYDTRMDTNLVQFDGEYNYIYRTEYEGRPGLVFGADFYPGPGMPMNADEYTALRSSREVLERYAYFYARPRRSETWTDFNGRRDYSPEALEQLSRDRFFYERVGPGEYQLGGDRPSDMIALYQSLVQDRGQTIYLSTDLFAHAIHLLFHTALKTAEEFDLSPQLQSFLDEMITAVELAESSADPRYPVYATAVELARDYLEVGRALLALAPMRNEDTFPITYDDIDATEVLAGYSETVRREVALIVDADGFATSPLTGLREDYSQYRPRGHYTENGVLTAYFRAMMWFGRVHFPISAAAEPVLVQEESAGEATQRLLPTALVIQQQLRENPDLAGQWRALFDPITALIGQSDDLVFSDLQIIADAVDWENLPAWLAEEENLSTYAERARQELRLPAIAGNSVFYALSEPSDEPGSPSSAPPGFRLFGQRFTHDSFVHQLTSSPRIMGRMFVAGIDIFDALGSASARGLLGSDLDTQEYDREQLLSTLDQLRGILATDDPVFFYRSYYTAHLRMLQSLSRFETGAGLYFTETPAWGLRALTAAHGSWAELRHDTLLYVKQVYAEMGGGDEGPTFRTMPFDRPIHYIEPNRDFFVAAINLLRILEVQDVLRGETLDLGPQLERFREILETAFVIVEKELEDQPISREENEFILSVNAQLVPIVTGAFASEYSSVPPEEYRRALVADVFTNVEIGQVLEIATGIPYRIHVLLNDGNGGKRIATGYGYSYYEFYGPMNRRMTNEEWRRIVYDSGESLDRYLPFWTDGILLPAGATTMLIDG